MSLQINKIRKDGEHRYAQMAWTWVKHLAAESATLGTFQHLFNAKVKSYRTSLPQQMKELYECVLVDQLLAKPDKHGNGIMLKALVKKKISEGHWVTMYEITYNEDES